MHKKQILTLSLLALGTILLIAINASLLTERRIYAKILSKPTLASTIAIANVAAKPSAALSNGEVGSSLPESGLPGGDLPGSGVGGDGTDFSGDPPMDDAPPGEPSDSDLPFPGVDPFSGAVPSDGMPPADSGQSPSAGVPSGGYPAPGSDGSGSNDWDSPGVPGDSAPPADPDDSVPPGYGDNPLPTLPPENNPVPVPTDVPLPTQPPEPQATATQPPAAPAAPTQPAPTQLPTAAPTNPPVQPTSVPATPTQQPTVPPTALPPTAQPAAGTLVSVPAGAAPKVDGAADDPAWAGAQALTVATSGGANHSATQVTVKSVYDGQRVYFLLTWADPTASLLRQPWEKQADGSWKKLIGAQNAGGDETEFYEDKLAFFWPIQNSLSNFNTQGCGGLCHAGENGKAVGNMYTAGSGQRADLWQMKAVRGAGQVDDQYLDNRNYSKKTSSAGFHADPFTGGGYRENQIKDKSAPAYMPPGGGDKTGAGFISETAKVLLEASLFNPGERVPSVLTAPFEGDRGDISGAWRYANGAWTLELSRALVTSSQNDVQFDDLGRAYAFALATFDNAQLRHAAQSGAAVLKFQK